MYNIITVGIENVVIMPFFRHIDAGQMEDGWMDLHILDGPTELLLEMRTIAYYARYPHCGHKILIFASFKERVTRVTEGRMNGVTVQWMDRLTDRWSYTDRQSFLYIEMRSRI